MHEMAWKESLRDRWLLANLPPKALRYIYCDTSYWSENALNWESIRQYRKSHREELRVLKNTELTPPYEDPDFERERVANARSAAAPKVGGAALKLVAMQFPEEHIIFHQELQEALDKEGSVSKASWTDWQGFYKDNEGEAHKVDLHRKRFDVNFEHEPKWVPVHRVESMKLPRKERAKDPAAPRRAVILPDLQIPFHDEQALQVALRILDDVKPDKVIFLGDLLDLSAWSKYIQRPEWAMSTQPALDYAHALIAGIRQRNRSAEIIVLEGNHEARMDKKALTNAQAAYGLKRADRPNDWPVLSVPNLLAFDKLDVEYVSGYPANRYWVNQNLQVRHGALVRSGSSTARAVSDDERSSTIFGHVHRIETQFRTKNVYEGGKTSAAYTPGCLCRIDGAVPSTKSGHTAEGDTVKNYEDWQQGIAVVTYGEGDAPFSYEQVYVNTMNNYKTMYRGKIYEAVQDVPQ